MALVRDEIYGIIPARGNSKGVPKKNILPLAGYPLIAYSIAASKLCANIGRTIVSTDSEEIAELAKYYGAEVPFLRPADLAEDLSPDRDFVVHALDWFRGNDKRVPKYLVHLRPTTPLRDPALIDSAIEMLVSRDEATSLRSGYEAPESPFKWFLRDDAGYFGRINLGESTVQDSNAPRQLFPSVYVPDGYVDVLRTSHVLNADEIHGERMIGYVSPVCDEIDSQEVFDLLEFKLQRDENKLLNFLKTNYPLEQ